MHKVRLDEGESFSAKCVECGLHLNSVPQDDHVDHQTERAELILLTFLVTLAQLAAFANEHHAAQAVASIAMIQLHERAAAHCFIIDVIQGMDSLVDAPKLSQRLRQACGLMPKTDFPEVSADSGFIPG